MKVAVIVFPGSNCARDVAVALARECGVAAPLIPDDDSLPHGLDLIVLPGGFSYGDYLRGGSIAARTPIVADIAAAARRGVAVLGICNGFQILTECKLLPGALRRNRDGRFIHGHVRLTVNAETAFTHRYRDANAIRLPVAHSEGRYAADDETLKRLREEERIVFRYAPDKDDPDSLSRDGSPNGSADDIAGLISENGRVLGLMPHPERAVDPIHESRDGRGLFQSLIAAL